MTIAADFLAYGACQQRIQVTSTSATIASFLAVAIPDNVTHVALVPENNGIHLNFGAAASASTFLVPLGGIILNANNASLDSIYLYAAATTNVHVLMGGNSLKAILGSSLATGDISIGNVGLLDTTETEIDPSTKQEQQILTSAPTAKIPVAIVKALAETPAPLALAASETYVTAFYVQAARADGDNTGNVFLGLVADLVSGTKNYYKLTPGATYEYKCRPGTKVNLALFGIDGETATDGVIGVHEPV